MTLVDRSGADRARTRPGRALDVARAFVWIGYRVSVNYPMSFVLDQVTSLVPLGVYYFIARLVGPVRATGGDYFTFVVLGLVGVRVVAAALRGIGEAVEDAIREGRLEGLLVQPVSWTMLPLGLSEWPMLWRLLNTVALCVLAVVLGADIRAAGVPVAVVVLALGAAAAMAVGIAAAAVKLLAKRTEPILTVYGIAATLLSGVYYPIDVLPSPLRAASWLIPDTYVIATLRRALMPQAEIAGPSEAQGLIGLAVFCALVFPGALWLFRRSVEYGRRTGMLGTY